jgi:hypothetical protein
MSDVLYESWDLRLPSIRPHSRLYPLEPIGIGTHLTESSTSYITRLAEAHCLTAGKLFLEIAPLLNRRYLSNPNFTSRPASFRGSDRGLNGMDRLAKDWIEAIEGLTLRTDIRYLTYITWSNVISRQLMLRHVSAWCPNCFEEWKKDGKTIYEPLLWLANHVKVCPRHQRQLEYVCPYCNRQLPILAHDPRPGYCSRCKRWLGCVTAQDAKLNTLTEQELTYNIWVAENIGELIAIAPSLHLEPSREVLVRNIKMSINSITEGKINTFARAFHLSSYDMIYRWVSGENRPRLDILLKICYKLGIKLLDFITKQNLFFEPELNSRELKKRLSGVDWINRPRGAELKNALLSALDENPPPCLREITSRPGFPSVKTLKKYFPDLCKMLSARARKRPLSNKKVCDKAITKRALESALKRTPPPALEEIAKELGYKNPSPLRSLFTDECKALLLRKAEYKIAQKKEICLKLQTILLEEPPPSLKSVVIRFEKKSLNSLKNMYPELCRNISSRHTTYCLEKRYSEICQNFRAALLEEPPPCVNQFARRHKYSLSDLYTRFGSECRAMTLRYQSHRARQVEERRKRGMEEIRNFVRELYERSIYPSNKLFEETVSPRNELTFPERWIAFRKAKREMGLE